jgi:hypothetical protein
MEEALRFFKENEVFIYLILGVVAVWQIRKFAVAWEELRQAAFGLERESAQARLNRAASLLIFVLLLGVAEFATVSYVVPTIPGALPLLTPTLDLLATPTTTLVSPNDQTPAVTITPASAVTESQENGCLLNEVMIDAPANGETVSGLVEIYGSANIVNFGFYKYEIAALNDPVWLTIAAGNQVVVDDKLGDWDTTRLIPGEYRLRLVITNGAGEASPACIVQVRVEAPTEE